MSSAGNPRVCLPDPRYEAMTEGRLRALADSDPRQLGRFKVLGLLGEGGMGRVYFGRSPGGWAVAIKVIHPGLAADPAFRARFAHEVATARAVGGIYTASVVDADTAAERPWLAVEYVAGPSLSDAVTAGGPLPLPAVLRLGLGLAEALQAIHAAGVVHRDLKPSNVLLAADGPRVIDFGIARAAEHSSLTRTGTILGSAGFMAPEQITGGETGPAADVFALGAVLTFAATGLGPFGEGRTEALAYRVVYADPTLDDVPHPVRAIVARCLAKDPRYRPAPGEVIAALAAIPGAGPGAGEGWLPGPVERLIGLSQVIETAAVIGSPAPAPANPPAPGPAIPPALVPQPFVDDSAIPTRTTFGVGQAVPPHKLLSPLIHHRPPWYRPPPRATRSRSEAPRADHAGGCSQPRRSASCWSPPSPSRSSDCPQRTLRRRPGWPRAVPPWCLTPRRPPPPVPRRPVPRRPRRRARQRPSPVPPPWCRPTTRRSTTTTAVRPGTWAVTT